MSFWLDCNKFKKMYTTTNNEESKQDLFDLATKINDTYIKPNSPKEINISYSLRFTAMNSIENSHIHDKLFDECIFEVETMIQNNVWNKFKTEMNALLNESLKIHKIKIEPHKRQITLYDERFIGIQNILSTSEYLKEYSTTNAGINS